MDLNGVTKFRRFHDLMPHRVREVLLVSSLYDAFILQEDGHLSEQVFLEYKELSLSSAPRFTHVTSGEAALRAMEKRRFDLVLAMTRLIDMDLKAFGQKVKKLRPGRPVVVLAFDNAEIDRLRQLVSPDSIDAVFMWNGDAKILLAIVKFVEDRENLDNDIAVADIRVILVVEDSVRFYSSFLAALYPELMKQSQSLFSEGLNRLQKLMRMRTRPKILHATTYEDAVNLAEKYRENLLAVISDIGFYHKGEHDKTAGLPLIKKIRKMLPDIPVLLQSYEEEYKAQADELGVLFVHKQSPSLLHDIRHFLSDHLGFGDFVFRLPDGKEVARANDTLDLERLIAEVPLESLEFHTRRNHISNWLMARSEFELAGKLRPQEVSDFDSIEDVRDYLLAELAKTRRDTREGMITDFTQKRFDPETLFQRMGNGSIGGKARGLAFMNLLLHSSPHFGRLSGLAVRVPQSFILATDLFDQFVETNGLLEVAYESGDDDLVARRFIDAKLPDEAIANLELILDHVQTPLAVRSSSLLEDDMIHPFAGIYRTIMIPNSEADRTERMENLCNAIKLVYASTFFHDAKAYVGNTAHRVEEEKMAVVIQRLVGQQYDDRYYPHMAGVAHSHNYYPLGPQKAEDGTIQLALGLGRIVVEGGQTMRFSPVHPAVLPQFSSPAMTLESSQKKFYALDLNCCKITADSHVGTTLELYDLKHAEKDGTLPLVGSVYNAQDDAISESPDARGPWVVTFNNVLKHRAIPLAPALVELLQISAKGLGTAVELEFAVDMGDYGRRVPQGQPRREPVLYALQLRPIITQDVAAEFPVDQFDREQVVCRSTQALGHGRFEQLADVVYIKNDAFDPAKTRRIATQVGEFNARLQREGRPYVLIGPGRWGSADHWLGIPVQWSQIAGARIIIEASPKGYNVDPSQGTHFFHNITALRLGYFTVPPGAHVNDPTKDNLIDWPWLDAQPAVAETEFLRHIRLEQPLVGMVDGRTGLGVIARGPAEPR